MYSSILSASVPSPARRRLARKSSMAVVAAVRDAVCAAVNSPLTAAVEALPVAEPLGVELPVPEVAPAAETVEAAKVEVKAATAVRGNLLGLNLRVDRQLTTGSGVGDNTMIIVNPDAYTWYESARLSLQTNVISTGQVQVGYYGYGAVATKLGAGAYRWMVA